MAEEGKVGNVRWWILDGIGSISVRNDYVIGLLFSRRGVAMASGLACGIRHSACQGCGISIYSAVPPIV